ncbi:RagB/SusD family nutrient uptake outer membrane protein [Marinifilum sp. RC60d5]|uniref:RagB/SusD family nutrient uptake outer membrane protein n=1 Tax=Marinifilum sp. RC60d5 TaxID=3458414 RepID=UPI0040367AEC
MIASVVLFASCDDFLNEPPNKSESVVPSTVEHLEFLLNDYTQFNAEENYDLIFGSDDFGLLTSLYDNNPSVYTMGNAHYATWDVEYLPVQEDRGYYSAEWKKIFSANLVLEYLSEVSGTDEDKLNLKAEAHFIRAYSYFQMVNTYCLPYATENMDEMGLPIKASTSFEESAERVTLQETWDYILADLEEALKLNRDLELSGENYRTWRASAPAVNAFAARVYLVMNDYAKAQSYAQAALSGHDEMMDYNTDMSYSTIPYSVPDGAGGTLDVLFPMTNDAQGAAAIRMEWKELYYFRFLYNGHRNYWASPELLSLYDQANDLRYKYHMVENYSYDRGLTIQYPAYIFFFDKIPSGPTVAEMLLIKSECQARLNQVAEAMTTVNLLRTKRILNTADASAINLSAGSQDEAIAKILEERRRELPFTQRFIDVRRFNNNSYAADDVVMTRQFYPVGEHVIEVSKGAQTLTLDKKSRKFARPLPQSDIDVTQGVLEQNTY